SRPWRTSIRATTGPRRRFAAFVTATSDPNEPTDDRVRPPRPVPRALARQPVRAVRRVRHPNGHAARRSESVPGRRDSRSDPRAHLGPKATARRHAGLDGRDQDVSGRRHPHATASGSVWYGWSATEPLAVASGWISWRRSTDLRRPSRTRP